MSGLSIQFNLLPDVKIGYIKAQRQKRFISIIAVWVTLVTFSIAVLLFVATNVWQKTRMNSLESKIKKEVASLKSKESIDKVLTVQSQLASLSQLHEQKPSSDRLFSYLTGIVPPNASLSRISADFIQPKIELTGQADSLEVVNKFVDTLKFTTFSVKGQEGETPAFQSVVLTSFGRDDKNATFIINLVFDPLLFNNTKEVNLTIPNKTTTRSATERPIFEKATTEAESQP